MTAATDEALLAEVRAAVAGVLDPELPMISIEDLGILRDVRVEGGGVRVTITPTYAGCPAMDAIRADIVEAVHRALPGCPVAVSTVLAPAWSTDDLTDAGRTKLAEAGIAPPVVSRLTCARTSTTGAAVPVELSIRCPQCGSPDTGELSRFGSTACKALWVCRACGEPFDRFKEH